MPVLPRPHLGRGRGEAGCTSYAIRWRCRDMGEGLKKSLWTLGLATVIAVVLVVGLAEFFPLPARVNLDFSWSVKGLTEFIRSLGGWGMAASVGLMMLHSFVPFPAEFLTVANGMVYGAALGTLVTWCGAMLGALASFGLSRRLGRPFVERFLAAKQRCRLDEWMQRQGVPALLLSRLLPLISFNLVNYAAGLTSVSWWTFVWTTGLGIIPMTVLMVVMGTRLHLMPWWGWLSTGLLLVLWLGWMHRRKTGACEDER